MRIAVTSTGPGLESAVDPRFGRCKCFVIVDSDTLDMRFVDNRFGGGVDGAGTAVAQAMVGKKVKVVLTGNCGPNAFSVLSAAGIKVVTGVAGTTVGEAVEAFKVGVLRLNAAPNVPERFGMRGRRPPKGGGAGLRQGGNAAP